MEADGRQWSWSLKLLVARSNERYREICGRIRLVPEDKEQDGGDSREVEVK